MPRVKRNNAAGSFTIEPHRLSNEAQVKLCDVLSLKDVYRVPDSILRQFPEAELAWPTNAPRKGVIQRARSGELVVVKPESGQTLYPVKERHDLPPRFMRVRAPNTVNGELTEQSLPTEAGKVLTEIENALGLYLTGAQHLDNTPRPAHYVAEFDPVAKSARKLFSSLGAIGPPAATAAPCPPIRPAPPCIAFSRSQGAGFHRSRRSGEP